MVGEREAADQTIAVRTREGLDLGVIPLGEFVVMVEESTSTHSIQTTGGLRDSGS